MPYTLCVLGCGTMGVAVASGVLSTVADIRASINGSAPTSVVAASSAAQSANQGNAIPSPDSSQLFDNDLETLPDAYIATVHREESARRLAKTFKAMPGGAAVKVQAGGNVEAVKQSDVVLLCCKPQMAKSILTEDGMSEALEHKLLISILAGTTIGQLVSWVPASTRVVRAMPNTPCKIREGMTVVTPPSPTSSQPVLDRKILGSLFSPIGRCRFLEEKHFDACTALSGSGPAFCLLVLEAMADGGVMMGLPRAEALELAAQTMQGAARMVLQSGSHPAAIKDSVTTPGGCTIAGLLTLEDGRVRSTIARCIQTATQHASGLGGAKEPTPGFKK